MSFYCAQLKWLVSAVVPPLQTVSLFRWILSWVYGCATVCKPWRIGWHSAVNLNTMLICLCVHCNCSSSPYWLSRHLFLKWCMWWETRVLVLSENAFWSSEAFSSLSWPNLVGIFQITTKFSLLFPWTVFLCSVVRRFRNKKSTF